MVTLVDATIYIQLIWMASTLFCDQITPKTHLEVACVMYQIDQLSALINHLLMICKGIIMLWLYFLGHIIIN